MKNKIYKKYITILIVTVILATSSLVITGVWYDTVKKKNSVRTEIIKIERAISQQQAEKITQPLTLHTREPGVVLLQRLLTKHENMYPEKKITGYYGDATTKAVKKFQKKHNLPQTGNVDERTKGVVNKAIAKHLCPEQVVIYPNFFFKKITKQTEPLPAEYVPPTLKKVSDKIKTLNTVCLQSDVIPNMEQMFQDAKKEGVHLAVSSGYRGHKKQADLFNYWYKKYEDEAKYFSTVPGKSEHQIGTTIDITDASIGYTTNDERFGKSDGGKWMKKNAHNYGFVMSYPKGKEYITGHQYKPWHWRFIGVAVAKETHKQKELFNTSTEHVQKTPFPKNDIKKGLTLSASTAIAIHADKGETSILLQKNRKWRVPIASITKIMTALVASEVIQPDNSITIKQSSIKGKGVSGKFFDGDIISLEDALHAILIESTNEIAIAIAETIGTTSFIQKMNEQAGKLNMSDTHFVNVTGLDPEARSEKMNYATVSDIAELLRYVFKNKKEIFAIMEKQEHTIVISNTGRTVPIKTTNELLNNQGQSLQVLGGKTGTTPKAKNNLAIVSKAPKQKGHIITVVLRSEDSFTDTQNLLRYSEDMFMW